MCHAFTQVTLIDQFAKIFIKRSFSFFFSVVRIYILNRRVRTYLENIVQIWFK